MFNLVRGPQKEIDDPNAAAVLQPLYDVPTIIYYDHELESDLRAVGFSDDAIMERLKDGGATVIDVSLDEEKAAGAPVSIPGDRHPTPLANRMRAAILKNYLEQNMSWVLVGFN